MFEKALLKGFQPELGIDLQDSESEEQENRRGDEALEIKNHSSKEESELMEGARKESRTETTKEKRNFTSLKRKKNL